MYGTQTGTRPTALPGVRQRRAPVTRDYGYWVENELLRARFGMEGVPVSIDFVKSE